MSLFVMVFGGELELSRDISRLRPDRVLTVGEKRPRGKFNCDPTVGTKCTYQNLELTDVIGDVAWMGSTISHIKL